MEKRFTLEPGTFFIGDPSLIFTNPELWTAMRLDLVENYTADIDDNQVWADKARHGKGLYITESGHFIPSPSGWIGIIPFEHEFKDGGIDPSQYGLVARVEEPLEVVFDDGLFRFGSLSIDTREGSE